jgi:pyruvate formate lyase activating enzyme
VKLDTNGSRPQVLKQLVEAGLVDYVAMDVKNSPRCYAATTGLKEAPLEELEESLRFLMEENVAYELRTTVVQELHDRHSITEMGQWLSHLSGGRKIPKLFLQPFVNRDSVLDQNLHTPEKGEITQFAELLNTFAHEVTIRG